MKLILGVHNHLPNGAAGEEFENLYNYKIRPLVSALYQFPRLHVVFHYSGVLLHWIERRHPELFVLIEDLLTRKQAELLGGGFYEPMMPLLPLTDRIGQIEMLTTYLRRQFGKRPQGCWLPPHAWEQSLVVPLGACGMNYTFLDEAAFSAAGAPLKMDLFYEPCITEDQGKIITVFPVSTFLKNATPAAMLEKLRVLAETGTHVQGPVTVFPLFSINPNEKAETEYQHFFEELSAADEKIEFTTPGRVYRNLRGIKKLYFTGNPAVSGPDYPPSPRQFLTDFPEANDIYAKMIHTRLLINQLRGDKARKHAALEELWKAQDSSLFQPSGLANTPVRKAAYCALLEADKITREKGSVTPSLSVFDYDLDGEDEFVFQDEKLNAYIKTRGALLSELDYLPRSWNFLDTFIPARNAGDPKTRRGAFSEYLVPETALPGISWQEIPGARSSGSGSFEVVKLDRLHRSVQFRLPPGEGILGAIEVQKTWRLKRNTVDLQYELKNTGSGPEYFFLAPSLDISFSGGTGDFVRFFEIRENSREAMVRKNQYEQTVNGVDGLEFQDLKNEAALTLESTRQFDARIFTVEAAANTAVPEYLFTCIMPLFPVSLESGGVWEAGFTLRISS